MDQPRAAVTVAATSERIGPLSLNRVLSSVTTLGPGRRLAIWVQGCSLACPGCASRDTWDPATGTPWEVDDLAEMLLQAMDADDLDGVTVTGGEPLQQAAAVEGLLLRLRSSLAGPVPVVLFTGYSLAAARKRAPWIGHLCDVVVAGRYLEQRPGALPLVASTNQQVWIRDDTARHTFDAWQRGTTQRLQVTADTQDLYLVGVPRPGELDAFVEAMERRGVRFGSVTWRT